MSPSQPLSEAGSMYNMTMHGGSGAVTPAVDIDDLPLAQRREMMMRQNSLMSINGMRGSAAIPNSRSAPMLVASAESVPFDSHQPPRGRQIPALAARDAKLANFRHSVAAELRLGGPVNNNSGSGRETPYTGAIVGGSAMSLLASSSGRGADVQMNIEAQRSFLMNQKEAEAQRRTMEQMQKATTDRAFGERMSRGDLMEVHREAMRRMQSSLNKS